MTDDSSQKIGEGSESTERAPNLKPQWKPGQSGNPKGRPPGLKDGPRAELNRLLRKNASPELLKRFAKKLSEKDKSYAAVMAQVHMELIMQGDMAAIKEAYAQVELPHPKDVKVSGDYNVILPPEARKCF